MANLTETQIQVVDLSIGRFRFRTRTEAALFDHNVQRVSQAAIAEFLLALARGQLEMLCLFNASKLASCRPIHKSSTQIPKSTRRYLTRSRLRYLCAAYQVKKARCSNAYSI